MDAIIDAIAEMGYSFFEFFASGGGATVSDLKLNGNMLDVSEWLWKYIAIVGLGMTLVYFLFELNQKFAFEGHDMNLKSIGAPFLKLAMAVILLVNGSTIVNGVLGFYNNTLEKVNSINVSVGGSVIDPEDTSDADDPEADPEGAKAENRAKIRAAVGNLGIFEALVMIPIMLIMWLLQMVLQIVWAYKALTFKLEFLWKVGMTPVAMSDIYHGFSSNAMRWIKGLIATAIYGASFILIVKLGNSLGIAEAGNAILQFLSGTNAAGEAPEAGEVLLTGVANFINGVKGIIKIVAVPFAELGVLGAVKQATREAFG